MQRKLVFTLVLLALALLAPVLVKNATPQTPLETIIIQSDGAVSPSTAPIQRSGNTYTFTDNIYATLKIFRSNIVLDGAGYTLRGSYGGEESDLLFIGSEGQPYNSTQQYTIGVDLGGTDVEGVTVRNLNVANFSIGMYMWTKNNTVVDNAVSGTVIGIMLSGSNTTITRNYISNNSYGVFYGFNNQNSTVPDDMIIASNSFEHNLIQLNGCQCDDYNTTEPPHNWDNGSQGNYWSDYNGTDANGDGIGDTAYTIDILNHDRYPLMQSQVSAPVVASQFPIQLVVFVVAFAVISVGIRVAVGRYRRKA